jgi:hypothetical protein
LAFYYSGSKNWKTRFANGQSDPENPMLKIPFVLKEKATDPRVIRHTPHFRSNIKSQIRGIPFFWANRSNYGGASFNYLLKLFNKVITAVRNNRVNMCSKIANFPLKSVRYNRVFVNNRVRYNRVSL